tara:strand:+ start:270 stop:554 length:285 start_codon:yes stop_codon:yes gene_type:complete
MTEFKKTSQESLERGLLELGAQVMNLKDEVYYMKKSHNELLEVIKGLRLLLDDKDIIPLDDFDALVDLGAALASAPSADNSYERAQSRLKKPWH